MSVVVVIEESSTIINKPRQGRVSLGEPPLQQALRTERKFAKSCVVVDQHPSGQPESVMANLGTRICLRLKNPACIRSVGMSMGLTHEQAEQIPTLPDRHAVVESNCLEHAVLVRIDEIEIPEPLPREEATREMREILKQFSFVPADEQPQPVANAGRAERRNREEAAKPATRMVAPSRPGGLSLDALKYLEHWNKRRNHFLPLTVFDTKHGIGTTKGNRIREELGNANCIEIRQVQTGNRGAQIRTVGITEKGSRVLKEMNVKPEPATGKGGWLHAFWQATVARWESRTYPDSRIAIEDGRLGKSVDVTAERPNGWLVAYEIQLSDKWTSQNAVKDLLTGCDEVVLCALKEAELEKMRERIECDLGPGEEASGLREKVSYRRLGSFV